MAFHPIHSLSSVLGKSDAVHAAFEYLAQLPGSRQKSVGIACLLAAGDPSGMPLLEQSLPSINDEDLARIVGGPVQSWRNSDQAAVRSLGRIATGLRAQGGFLSYLANALAEVHTADTLPYLALLLDSPDPRVRIKANGGFSAFVGGLPIPTKDNFANGQFMVPSPTPYSSDPSWKAFAIPNNPSTSQLNAASVGWKNWLDSHPELPQVQ